MLINVTYILLKSKPPLTFRGFEREQFRYKPEVQVPVNAKEVSQVLNPRMCKHYSMKEMNYSNVTARIIYFVTLF